MKKIRIEISKLPEDEEIAQITRGRSGGGAVSNQLNMSVVDLSDEQRQEMGIDTGGILVQDVDAGPAQKAGIRKGDVVLLLNNTTVKDVKHFAELVEGLPEGKSIPILIQRQGNPIFLAFRISGEKD